MTRDFRKGAPPPRRRAAPRGTCAFWFLTGGVLGAVGVGFAWMKQDPPAPLAAWLQAPPTEQAAPASAAPGDAPKPKFNFYSLLPDEKVVVPPDAPPPPPVALPPPGARPTPGQAPATLASLPAPAATGKGDFLLQVGSFKRTTEAEKRKAELALLGIQTSIQTVSANGQTYYRVRTGAYNKANANAVKARLQQNGHDSMMIRAR